MRNALFVSLSVELNTEFTSKRVAVDPYVFPKILTVYIYWMYILTLLCKIIHTYFRLKLVFTRDHAY